MANVPYSPSPTVEPSSGGSGATYGSVPEASPAAFGAGVGQAFEKLGATGEQLGEKSIDLATQFARQATEAKANDVIANQWAPAAAKLSGAYMQKKGMDAVAGLQPYQDSLTALHNEFLANAKSPYEREILGNYMTRHVAQEMDGAQRYQDQQLTAFEDESHKSFVGALSGNVIANYNNADVIGSTRQQMDGQIQKHGMDRGLSQEMIDEQKRNAWGETIRGAVTRAVANGDVATASKLYGENRENIPGHEQLEIDKVLHGENMRQFGDNAASALLSGLPVPNAPAGAPAQVKAIVADAATSAGIDPNHALTVAHIESNYGQNVGKRGDIGQTGKGGDLGEQAGNMVGELKKSQDIANTTLGRPAEPWEGYVCYQQGAGGGPALLRAAQDNPLVRAVDVLRPLYSTPKEALSAVVNNGGNATMTAGQFLDFIKQKYSAAAGQSKISLPSAPVASGPNPVGGTGTISEPAPASVGDAIVAPHESAGIAAQPGATPVQALLEMDKVYPDAVMQANQIPNIDQREAALNALEQKHKVYQISANAYTATLMNQAQKLAVDPKFTNVNQIPAELSAALLADHPQTLAYMETRANYNLEHGSGVTTKDMKEYGQGVNRVLSGIWDKSITSISQLQAHVANGELTIAGYDRMEKELMGKNTPDGDAESKMREETFKTVKRIVSGQDDVLGLKDPKGEELYAQAMPVVYKAIEEAKTKGTPIYEIYNPKSKDWVGHVAEGLKRSQSQQAADMINSNDAPDRIDTSTREGLILAVQKGVMTREAGEAEALKRGYIRPKAEGPAVPLAGTP